MENWSRDKIRSLWMDIRTLAEMTGEFVSDSRPAPQSIQNLADGLDDVAARMYKLAEELGKK